MNVADVVAGAESAGAARGTGESEQHNPDGTSNYVRFSEKPWGYDDYVDFIREKGMDPDRTTFTWGWTSNPYGGFWNKLNNVRPAGAGVPPADELFRALDNWTPEALPPSETLGGAFVVCPADVQMGKGDYGLTHEDTIARVMASWAKAAEFCREYRPGEILIAELGDSVENFNNTSSQRSTNTLAITEQIRAVRRLMLEGIKMLAPLTDRLVYAAVPSNHGSVRIGPKSPENHVLDDYGIEIAEQLRDICAESPHLQHVEVVIPDTSSETLCVDVAGTAVGMAHGHQANGADGLGKFWAGQSHGRMPLGRADIALFGHHHSLRVQQSGDARWLFVSPAQDNGSSWFTNRTGERSATGMLSFTTLDGAWADLAVL